MLLQKISLLKLSELKRQQCPDTPSYASRDITELQEAGCIKQIEGLSGRNVSYEIVFGDIKES